MLLTYPNLEVISRDGAAIYAAAATNSHPEVLQISDRFHLIKGLYDAVRRIIIRMYPARVVIPSTGKISDELQVLYNTANRTQRILFAKEKRKLGMTISEIALLLHTTEKTVKKYIDIQSIST